jgi:hypothetical protein
MSISADEAAERALLRASERSPADQDVVLGADDLEELLDVVLHGDVVVDTAVAVVREFHAGRLGVVDVLPLMGDLPRWAHLALCARAPQQGVLASPTQIRAHRTRPGAVVPWPRHATG